MEDGGRIDMVKVRKGGGESGTIYRWYGERERKREGYQWSGGLGE